MDQQAPKETWTGWNHRFESGRTKDGYAVCTLCGVHENEDGIIEPCPNGPAVRKTTEARRHDSDSR